jgi:amidase
MKERGVDFILCPAYPGVAPEVGTPTYWLYTAIWNLLDQPAIIFPTGLTANPSVDVAETDYKPRSEQDGKEFAKCKSLSPRDWRPVCYRHPDIS